MLAHFSKPSGRALHTVRTPATSYLRSAPAAVPHTMASSSSAVLVPLRFRSRLTSTSLRRRYSYTPTHTPYSRQYAPPPSYRPPANHYQPQHYQQQPPNPLLQQIQQYQHRQQQQLPPPPPRPPTPATAATPYKPNIIQRFIYSLQHWFAALLGVYIAYHFFNGAIIYVFPKVDSDVRMYVHYLYSATPCVTNDPLAPPINEELYGQTPAKLKLDRVSTDQLKKQQMLSMIPPKELQYYQQHSQANSDGATSATELTDAELVQRHNDAVLSVQFQRRIAYLTPLIVVGYTLLQFRSSQPIQYSHWKRHIGIGFALVACHLALTQFENHQQLHKQMQWVQYRRQLAREKKSHPSQKTLAMDFDVSNSATHPVIPDVPTSLLVFQDQLSGALKLTTIASLMLPLSRLRTLSVVMQSALVCCMYTEYLPSLKQYGTAYVNYQAQQWKAWWKQQTTVSAKSSGKDDEPTSLLTQMQSQFNQHLLAPMHHFSLALDREIRRLIMIHLNDYVEDLAAAADGVSGESDDSLHALKERRAKQTDPSIAPAVGKPAEAYYLELYKDVLSQNTSLGTGRTEYVIHQLLHPTRTPSLVRAIQEAMNDSDSLPVADTMLIQQHPEYERANIVSYGSKASFLWVDPRRSLATSTIQLGDIQSALQPRMSSTAVAAAAPPAVEPDLHTAMKPQMQPTAAGLAARQLRNAQEVYVSGEVMSNQRLGINVNLGLMGMQPRYGDWQLVGYMSDRRHGGTEVRMFIPITTSDNESRALLAVEGTIMTDVKPSLHAEGARHTTQSELEIQAMHQRTVAAFHKLTAAHTQSRPANGVNVGDTYLKLWPPSGVISAQSNEKQRAYHQWTTSHGLSRRWIQRGWNLNKAEAVEASGVSLRTLGAFVSPYSEFARLHVRRVAIKPITAKKSTVAEFKPSKPDPTADLITQLMNKAPNHPPISNSALAAAHMDMTVGRIQSHAIRARELHAKLPNGWIDCTHHLPSMQRSSAGYELSSEPGKQVIVKIPPPYAPVPLSEVNSTIIHLSRMHDAPPDTNTDAVTPTKSHSSSTPIPSASSPSTAPDSNKPS